MEEHVHFIALHGVRWLASSLLVVRRRSGNKSNDRIALLGGEHEKRNIDRSSVQIANNTIVLIGHMLNPSERDESTIWSGFQVRYLLSCRQRKHFKSATKMDLEFMIHRLNKHSIEGPFLRESEHLCVYRRRWGPERQHAVLIASTAAPAWYDTPAASGASSWP